MKNNVFHTIGLVIAAGLSLASCNAGSNKQSYNSLNSYENMYQAKFLNENSTIDGIEPGVGYSTDAKHIAPMACFNPSQVVRDGTMSVVRTEALMDFENIEKYLENSVRGEASFLGFGAKGARKYINDQKAKSLSISLNFAEVISRNVNVKYPTNIKKLLTSDGLDAYADGNNPKFRLFCGDRLIHSYQEGALIILSMQVKMADKYQKKTMESYLKAEFSTFGMLKGKLKEINTQQKLNGRIEFAGYQVGGDPTQLSKALDGGVLTCDLNKIDDCDKVINGIMTYISKSLPEQFKSDKAYTPTGGLKLGWLLDDDLGMKLAPSFVTKEVIQARNELSDYESKNQANYSALSDVLNYYPVPLDVIFKKKVTDARNVAHSNLAKLQEANDCWSFPSRCLKIRDSIKSSLVGQVDKNLINQFSNVQNFEIRFWNGVVIKPSFYPTASNSKQISLQLGTGGETDKFYFIKSGLGIENDVSGGFFDRGTQHLDKYKIWLLNNKYVIGWGDKTPIIHHNASTVSKTSVNNDFNSILH